MRRGAAAIVVGLLLSACASLPPQPASLETLLRLQLRQRAGLYPGDWIIDGDSHKRQYDALTAWATHQGIVIAPAPIQSKNLLGHVSYGQLTGWVVLINEDLPVNSRLYTLLHELGHIYGPHKVDTAGAETIAEVIAGSVCARLGLEAWPETAAYLAVRVPDLDKQTQAVQLYGAEIDRVIAKLTAAASALNNQH